MSRQNRIQNFSINDSNMNCSKGTPEKTNNSQITNLPTDQTIFPGNSIPLTVNSIINGTDISHKLGSSDIILAPNQIYLAVLELEVNDSTLSQIGFKLNNTFLPQKDAQIISSGNNISPNFLSTSTVFNTPFGNLSTLQIHNISCKPINISGLSFSIIKII